MNSSPNSKSKSTNESPEQDVTFYNGCLGIVVIILGLALLGWIFELTGVVKDEDSGSKKDETTVVASDVMPDAVGMTYAEALDRDAKFYDDHYAPDYFDLIEDRSVWDNENWAVVAQSPKPGTLVEPDQRICFGLVKIEEINESRKILKCWQNVYDSAEITDFTFDFIQKDLLKINSTNKELNGYFLKVSVQIDLGFDSFDLDYCSSSAFGKGGTLGADKLLELDKLNDQDSYYYETWWDYYGDYKYRIKGVSKNLGSGCSSY